MRRILIAYLAALTTLITISIVGAAIAINSTGPDTPAEAVANRYGFNFVTWELKHLPEKWLYKIGDLVADNRKGAGDDNDILARYSNLVTELNTLDPSTPEYAHAEEERAWLENTAENIIEARVATILENQGLTIGPPPFTDLDIVFPPVDFEFDDPPRVLAISPRDRLTLIDDTLLTSGLDRETAEEIEAEAESDGDVSALVVGAGGIATYPSIIIDTRPLDDIIDTVFHEWTHQYLIFFPLGSRYFQGSQLRTLNESVASLTGNALAEIYFERYGHLDEHGQPEKTPAAATPSPSPGAGDTTPSPGPVPEFDFTKEMRALRVEIEAMLADGKIEEAEARMNQKRDEFETRGVFIRKLNQAYFAFNGFYADSPGSIDPIGPKLQTVLDEAGSPGRFIHVVRAITSTSDLDAIIRDLGG